MPPQLDTTDSPTAASSNGPGPIDRRSLNLPNLITLSRFVLSIVLFGMMSLGKMWIASAAVFAVAAATDFLDGYIARKYQLITTLGRILDPFVDKIIICGAFVFLLERSTESGVNGWIVIAVVGREMFVTGLRSFLEQHGRDFSAVWSGKIKMALQCMAVFVALVSMDEQFATAVFREFRDVTLWATAVFTVYTGVLYAWRGFRMLAR